MPAGTTRRIETSVRRSEMPASVIVMRGQK